MSLVGLAIPFVSGSVTQAYFVGFVSIGWLALQCQISPFRWHEDNALKAYCDFAVLCAAMTALAKQQAESELLNGTSLQHTLFSSTLLVVLIGLVPATGFALVMKCLRLATRYHGLSPEHETNGQSARPNSVGAPVVAFEHYANGLHTRAERKALRVWLELIVREEEAGALLEADRPGMASDN